MGEVGPPGNKQKYHQPAGWTRYGLNVMGKFNNGDDTWLHPFQHENNWWRAYHCTNEAGVTGIMGNGFKASTYGDYGPGLYVSPYVEYAAKYAGKGLAIQTKSGNKNLLLAFQVAVRPGKAKFWC